MAKLDRWKKPTIHSFKYIGLIIVPTILCLCSQINFAITTTKQVVGGVTATIGDKQSVQDFSLQSYDRTYRSLVESCLPEDSVEMCFQRTLKSTNTTFPWWFRTLLRDAHQGRGLGGHWHNLASNHVEMCLIEKVGSNTWRNVFFALNNGAFRSENITEEHLPKIVFFRDPLERFLSAYMNKCLSAQSLRNEKHCEPYAIFENPNSTKELKSLTNKRKELFAAYVDVMPLTWNVHFFPQAIYCDGLFRHLPKYDYVGNMGPTFYHELVQVGQRYGNEFEAAVNATFDVERHLNSTNVFQKFLKKSHATAAMHHLEEFYTPHSLKRVLQYVSIDYMTLGLPFPAWAQKMLQDTTS